MASAKALFGAVVGRFIFREATVTALRDLGPRFRLVELAGEALKGAVWTPGDKLQVFLGGQGMRTYTPLAWDASRGTMGLLLYVHGRGPGAAWASGLARGETCSFFGPRSSIPFPQLADDVVFVGDETSFAAACALVAARKTPALVFEVDDVAESRAALDAVGLDTAHLVQREPADAHLEAMAKLVGSELDARPTASFAMTGRAQTIQLLRARLHARGALRPGKTKAYWSVGKSGLD